MAIPFASFEDALSRLPKFIGGIDPLGHKTISDLAFLVQHEIDLWVEGESNEIECPRRTDTTKRYQRCRAFLDRCDASLVAEE